MADWYGKSTDQILDWLGQGKKTIFGDPEAIKASYDQAINASREQGQQIPRSNAHAPRDAIFDHEVWRHDDVGD